ncbi:MAG TPA: sensor domain-containing diguanylate cyclase, partial [Azospira sp.]|nr:sensor domain-containing diguanylate cyclase [Azospira sp.]
RSLMESAPFPIVITRLSDGQVVYINRRASACFGVEQNAARGQSAPDYWVDLGQRAKLMEALQRNGSASDMEARLRDGKGETFWALISARTMKEDGQTVVFVSFIDITERKQTESALRKLNGQLAFRLQEIDLLQDKLKEQAIRDALTGLFNRRYLDETLEREVTRAQREGYPLAIAMLDLDHFKRLNDTYGHRAGDEMLRTFGQFLAHHARGDDIPCRYGGEEFVLVLPHVSQEVAMQRAEEWRAAFAEMTVNFGHLQLKATVSIGIACYPDHGAKAGKVLDAADAALYQAKEMGRNRVVLAGSKGH